MSTLVVVTQLLPHTTSTESQKKAGDGGAAPQWPRCHCAPHCASACWHCTARAILHTRPVRIAPGLDTKAFFLYDFGWLFLTNLRNCLLKTPRLQQQHYPNLDQLFVSRICFCAKKTNHKFTKRKKGLVCWIPEVN